MATLPSSPGEWSKARFRTSEATCGSEIMFKKPQLLPRFHCRITPCGWAAGPVQSSPCPHGSLYFTCGVRQSFRQHLRAIRRDEDHVFEIKTSAINC